MDIQNVNYLGKGHKEYEEETIFHEVGLMRSYNYTENPKTGEVKTNLQWFKKSYKFDKTETKTTKNAAWQSLTQQETIYLEKLYQINK